MSRIQAGFGKARLDVPLGVRLGGYASDTRRATALHDPLYARVLLLDSSGSEYCIVQTDLLDLDSGYAELVRQALVTIGFDKHNIQVGAIHTHSGPVGTNMGADGFTKGMERIFGEYDKTLCASILESIIKAARDARDTLAPASLKYGTTLSEGVGANRINPTLPNDPVLFALEGQLEGGKSFVLYNLGVHPTILNGENTQISADLAGGVAAVLEGSRYDFVMFANGSAGDVSTRFTRKASSFEEVERLGGLLAGQIEKALAAPEALAEAEIKVSNVTVAMQVKKFDTVEDARKKWDIYLAQQAEAKQRHDPDLRLYESRAEGAATNLLLSENYQGVHQIQLAVTLVRFGKLIFVFVPGELFSALSNPLRREFGPQLVFCTYMNGYQGYLADIAAYEAETYESLSSPYQKGEGEKLMEQIRLAALALMK